MYRTITGQTGKDAYRYELAAIANARRELDERMSALMTTMQQELPEGAAYRMPIPSPRFPDAWLPGDRETILRQLNMSRSADRHNFEFIETMLKTLTTPEGTTK